ncbi:Retrotrans gag domain-containing protein [Abeliophyllum distichum]|uniref:Retrotrans gag domain-containing protein n=1 Tax=Abeliophyllum distichum TaxID=126358 RepID=A0ABD1QEW6_9LAMI
MHRGGRTRRLQDILPQTHIAPDRDNIREDDIIEESVYQPPEYSRQGNLVENDPIAIERIAAVVVSAMRSTNRDFSIERATKLGAKVFIGTTNLVVAKAWMIRIERVFDVMGCPNDRKLCLATFLLEDGEYDWWQSV